ncbi:MAG TPA: hypothetical protein PK504_06845 [Ferruginibacter sp.]|nr:hypothetical protein [Ferruginibacter sp.]HRE62707.1 hypothetical protein [Ferruginibacter sp.]
MKRILSISTLFIAIAFVISGCSTGRKTIAIEEGWELIGETKVNFVKDKGSMDVMNTNLYTAIRFKVEKKPIKLKGLYIVFPNGDKLSPLIDAVVEADQFSREIAVAPEGRNIRSIDFNYRSKGNIFKGRAKVLVFGKRYIAPTATPRSN